MATDTTLLQWIESALASHLQEDAPNHDHSYTQQHEADDSSANFISTSTAYLELISSIRSMSDPIEIKQLCTVLIGCLGTIALHSNRFQDLVHALLSVDWIRCHLGVTPKDPSTVASCYVTMLGHLVSQNSCFLPPCLHMLVRHLLCEDLGRTSGEEMLNEHHVGLKKPKPKQQHHQKNATTMPTEAETEDLNPSLL